MTNVLRILVLSLFLAKYFFNSNIFYNGLGSLCDLLTVTSTFPTFSARTFSNLLISIVVSSYTRFITLFSNNFAFSSSFILMSLLFSLLTLFSTISVSSTFLCFCCSFSSLFNNNEFFFSFYFIYCSLLVRLAFSSLKCTLQLLYAIPVLLSNSL